MPVGEKSAQHRRMDILETILTTNGRLSTADLAKRYGIGQNLLANDLKILEDLGLVERGHGWVIRRATDVDDLFRGSEYAERAKRHAQAKEAIAEYIVENLILKRLLVQEGAPQLLLDAGSTAYAIARKLIEKGIENINVITNNVPVVLYLSRHSTRILCTLVGGEYSHWHAANVGGMAAQAIEGKKTPLAVLTPRGISLEVTGTGELGIVLYSEDGRQHAYKRNLARNGNDLVIALDHSKWAVTGEHLITLIPSVEIASVRTRGPVRTRGALAAPVELVEDVHRREPNSLQIVTNQQEGHLCSENMQAMIRAFKAQLEERFEDPSYHKRCKEMLESIVTVVDAQGRPILGEQWMSACFGIP